MPSPLGEGQTDLPTNRHHLGEVLPTPTKTHQLTQWQTRRGIAHLPEFHVTIKSLFARVIPHQYYL